VQLKIEPVNADALDYLLPASYAMGNGQFPEATPLNADLHYRLDASFEERNRIGWAGLKSETVSINFTIDAYDRAGEDFDAPSTHPLWDQLAVCDGLVLLLKPDIRSADTRDVRGSMWMPPMAPTDVSPVEANHKLVHVGLAKLQAKRRVFDNPEQFVAVCLPKFDHPDIFWKLHGKGHIEPRSETDGVSFASPPMVPPAQAEAALPLYANLQTQRLIETKLAKGHAEYFAMSAIGFDRDDSGLFRPSPEGGALSFPKVTSPVGTLDPFFWIIRRVREKRLGK
jgi:hypothetical protein